ncbi:MAG: FAD-binding oxidoreductase [Kouleothrix sp.]|nr:FAD-binding oxidoreductase [Kouleothrix sp.]
MTIAIQPSTATRSFVSAGDQFKPLRSRLAGQLITAASPDFDAARKVRFITIDRRPLAIVQAASAQDVAETVRFARDRALPLAVRSGGHSLAHLSVIDDAIVVDLSGMKRISIDPAARIAHVQPGATSGDLAGPAHAHGLALSTGDTHSVGMGGLTTGGGIGFIVRKYGLAIDNLLAAQVVTADGDIVTASASERPDLFWAIRGGGGNFGIVTEFTYRLAPVGQILGGELMLPASREVIRGYLDYVAAAPDDLTTIANLWHAPPAPYVPQERVGELVLSILVCWTGSVADGERALAPLGRRGGGGGGGGGGARGGGGGGGGERGACVGPWRGAAPDTPSLCGVVFCLWQGDAPDHPTPCQGRGCILAGARVSALPKPWHQPRAPLSHSDRRRG